MLRRSTLENLKEAADKISTARTKAVDLVVSPPAKADETSVGLAPDLLSVDMASSTHRPSNEANPLMGNELLMDFVSRSRKGGGTKAAKQEEMSHSTATYGGYPNLRWRMKPPKDLSLADEVRKVQPDRDMAAYDTGKAAGAENHTFMGLLTNAQQRKDNFEAKGSIDPAMIQRFLMEDEKYKRFGLFQKDSPGNFKRDTHPKEWLAARKKAILNKKKDFGQGAFFASHIGRDVKAATAVLDLISAVRFNRLDEVIFLCLLGTPINILGPDDTTPLMEAAIFGQTEITEYLLDLGADINLKNTVGQSALLFAAMHSRDDIIDILLERGANVNARDFRGLTPLHAASTNFVKMKTILHMVDFLADMTAKGPGGNTPLHLACSAGKFEVILPMIKAGADLQMTNDKGQTAEEACPSGLKQMLEERLKTIKPKEVDNKAMPKKEERVARLSRPSGGSIGGDPATRERKVSRPYSAAGRSSISSTGSESRRAFVTKGSIIAQVDRIMTEGYDFVPNKDSIPMSQRVKRLPGDKNLAVVQIANTNENHSPLKAVGDAKNMAAESGLHVSEVLRQPVSRTNSHGTK